MVIKIKRIYEEPSEKDGTRILVDRLWPRGVSKENARVVEWAKEISPELETIKSFHSKKISWIEFKKEYFKQLKKKKDLVSKLKNINNLTLVYSAKDEEHNNAIILKEFLEKNPISF